MFAIGCADWNDFSVQFILCCIMLVFSSLLSMYACNNEISQERFIFSLSICIIIRTFVTL